jgi:putative nucleotidyltransferase with HDIG domain
MTRSYRSVAAVYVPVAAIAYYLITVLNLGEPLKEGDTQGLIAFVSIALLSEVVAVDFRLGDGHKSQTSMAFLPFLGIIVLFAPHIAAVTLAAVALVSQVTLRRNAPARAAINTAVAALSAIAAGGVFHMMKGIDVHLAVAFPVAAAMFFGSNLLLISIAAAYLDSSSPRSVLLRVAGPNGSNFFFDLLASPIAVVPVLLYDTSPVLGVIVIVLPLILINHSYSWQKHAMKANKDLLRALIKAIETRDPYTSGHSERVAVFAKAIAHELGMPFRKIDQVETAALLHDIGKIDAVFADVLQKPHDLTDEERRLIETHPQKGADLLKNLSSVRPEVIAAVLHHHERFDGGGYPHGLRGDMIPVAARIIMLSDSIDAMLSDRPYRKALSADHVRAELQRCAGSQFDPQIVSVITRSSTLDTLLARRVAIDPSISRDIHRESIMA